MTIDGQAIWAIVRRAGVRQRVGLDGVVVGLDWNAALALGRAAGIEPQVAAYLFGEIERNMLEALQEGDNG